MRTLDGQSIPNIDPPSSTYPYGRAKNSSPPSARNGTPIQEEDLLTDIPYAMLAVMKEAGINPDEVAEDIDTSQFKDAILSLISTEGHWLRDGGGFLYPKIPGDDIVTTGYIRGGAFVTDSDIGIVADLDLLQLTTNLLTVNGGLAITGVLTIPDGGYIRTVTTANAIQIEADGGVVLPIAGQNLTIGHIVGNNQFNIVGTDNVFFGVECYDSRNSRNAIFSFYKSGSSTLGTRLETADGEALGTILAYGVNTSGVLRAPVAIQFYQEGAAAAQIGGNIRFFTGTSTAGRTERMRLTAEGELKILNNSFGIVFGALSKSTIYDDNSNMIFNSRLTGTGDFVFLNGDIQLSNARQAGDPATDGFVVLKDSTGTQYKIPCLAV